MEKQLDKQNGLKSHMEMSINNLEAEVEEKQVGNGKIKDEVFYLNCALPKCLFPRSLVVLNLFLKAVHIKAYCLDLLDLALFKAWQCILCWCSALGRSLNKSKLLAQEKVK